MKFWSEFKHFHSRKSFWKWSPENAGHLSRPQCVDVPPFTRMWLFIHALILGWGLLSQFSPLRYFPYFPLLSKQTLAIEYHVYIWQVSPQLSCGDTRPIWMWFRESNRYFCKIENFAYWEISERSFSNPHPWISYSLLVKESLSERPDCISY